MFVPRFKDLPPDDDDGGDEYPAALLDALEDAYEALGDWQPITDALLKLATPALPVKASVLTDQGASSLKAKGYNVNRDPLAIALGADQVGR